MTKDNQTNCAGCDHKQNGGNGYCYMFEIQPQMPCPQHSNRVLAAQAMRVRTVQAILRKTP